jgi:hypothetical protein
MVPAAGRPTPHKSSVKLADSIAALDDFIAALLSSPPNRRFEIHAVARRE